MPFPFRKDDSCPVETQAPATSSDKLPAPVSRKRKWFRRIVKSLFLCAAVLILAALGLLWRMDAKDREHANFLECGKDVNKFLKKYAAAIRNCGGQRDVQPLLAFYSSSYSAPLRGEWVFQGPEDLGDVLQSRYVNANEADFSRDELKDDLSRYIATSRSVKNVECKINEIEVIRPHHEVVLTVKYILDGEDTDDSLFQDRFFFRWHLKYVEEAKEDELHWQITKDELVEGVRVAGKGTGFRRVKNELIGLVGEDGKKEYVHARDKKLDPLKSSKPLKFGVIQQAAGGATSVDYDLDGKVDLFFPDGIQSRLYRNTSDGETVSFRDVTEESGLKGLDQATCGLFADVDGDGDLDLFVTRYYAPCRMYLNDGKGSFSDAAQSCGLDFTAPCMAACILDFDLDGRLDLYVGINGNAFEQSPNIPFYATNAEPNRLFRNIDGQRFEDVTITAGVGTTGWTLAVCAGDYDGDGDTDLGVANDFGRKVLYQNNGNGTFSDVAKEAGVLDFSGGMGIAFADFNDDRSLDIYTSNINSNQRWFGEESTLWQYSRNLVRTKWVIEDLPHFRELYGLIGDEWRTLGQQVGEGNSLFYNNSNGTFRELKDCHATRAGWSWGVAPFDMDNDADLDIYVCNGWVSGPKTDDL